jgi:hypothetical protein
LCLSDDDDDDDDSDDDDDDNDDDDDGEGKAAESKDSELGKSLKPCLVLLSLSFLSCAVLLLQPKI